MSLLYGLLEAPSLIVKHGNTHQGVEFLTPLVLKTEAERQSACKCLGGKLLTPTRIFIKGTSVLEAIEFTLSFFEVVFDTCPKFGWFPLYEQLEIFRVVKQWPESMFIKYAKFFTAYPFAFYLKNDLPKVPEGYMNYCSNPLLYTGRLKRFFKNRLLHPCKASTNLFWAILQGVKRGCKEASPIFVAGSYQGHRQKLSTPPRGEVAIAMLGYINRFLDRNNFHFGKFSRSSLHEASLSASYTTSRSKGGQREDVRNWLIQHYGEDFVDVIDNNGVKRVVYAPVIPDNVDQLIDDVYEEFGTRPLKVRVQAILEPLKVRLISAGESIPYWIARDAQKKSWEYLQSMVTFIATGKPLETSDIVFLQSKRNTFQKKYNVTFDKWVSGDYSGATDGVDIRLTASCFEAMLRRSDYSPHLKDILRGVIYQQELHYPKMNFDGVMKELPSALQQNGQLMGSVLSFPILCIINLCAYWYAMEEYLGSTIDPVDLPVYVNGDDILFPCNDQFYEVWKEKVFAAGFDLSIGKNYIHSNFFTMNSILFHENRVTGEITRYGFLNVGLLTGKAKTTGRQEIRDKPIWDWYDSVIAGATDKLRAHRRFLHYHRRFLKKATRNGKRNLFAARELGGLGFHLDPEVEPFVTFTPYQRKLARYFSWFLRKRAKAGSLPNKYIVRLSKEQGSSKSYACIDLGFYDTYEYVPLYSPLNVNQSLEKKRLYDLPLLARSAKERKSDPVFHQGAELPSCFKLEKPGNGKLRQLCEFPYRLVSVTRKPIENLLSSYTEEIETPDGINQITRFDPDSTLDTEVNSKGRYQLYRKGYWSFDNDGDLVYTDSRYFDKNRYLRPIVKKKSKPEPKVHRDPKSKYRRDHFSVAQQLLNEGSSL